MNFSIHQASRIGDRKFNQDRAAYAYDDDALLLVLADGMGGHLHGELAASMVVETFVESFPGYAVSQPADPQDFLSETMRHANQRILNIPHSDTANGAPGSTCVAALIRDGELHYAHAGDSRLYLLRDGAVRAVTRDHSMVQQWVDMGMISSAQARVHPQRNRITNCLGGLANIFHAEPGMPIALHSGDVLLLGSDGLWGPFSDEELAQAFASGSVAETLDGLIAQALERERGKADNVTGIALRWGKDEPAHHTIEPVSEILEIL